jgi:uncharacterized membrane protein
MAQKTPYRAAARSSRRNTNLITVPAYRVIGNILCRVKHFLVYSALRIALFVACWAAVAGIGAVIFGSSYTVGIWAIVVAAVLSSVLSLKLLEGPRERFAQSVEARASRASARFDELKNSEDAD